MKNGLQCALRLADWVWQRLLGRYAALWLAVFTFLWLASTSWTYPLLLPDEGRYVGVAWAMNSNAQYLTPMLDGLPYFHKPPLFYWLTAAALSLFGDNAWAGRLCSVLAATIMVTAFFLFLRRHAAVYAAAAAALILAVQPFFFGAGHYANLDMLVSCLMSLTVLAGAQAAVCHENAIPGRRWVLTMHACAALGFLAKGLIGVVLPAAILFFWLLGRRRFTGMVYLLWWPGIAVFLLLSLPWMIAMQWQYPQFLEYYIVRQHIDRFLQPVFNNPHPFWFYVPVLLGLTLPWSWRLWHWFRLRGPLASLDGLDHTVPDRFAVLDRPALRGLMLSWLLVILVFFSIPVSKLVGYVVAALPPLAWFIQETFEQGFIDDERRSKRSMGWYAAVAAALCLLAVLVMSFVPQRSTKQLASELRAHAQPGERLVMLDTYAFDLPFYAQWQDPIIVVSHWDEDRLRKADDWRLELFDAAAFDPKQGRERLWRADELQLFMCRAEHPGVWLVGYLHDQHDYAVLADRQPVRTAHKMGLWHVPAGEIPGVCNEMPASGPQESS